MSESNSLQEKIFKTIVHHEADREYIHVNKKGVTLKFPLKIQMDFSVDGKKLSLETYQKKELFAYIKTLFESDLKYEGFVCLTDFSEDWVVEFHKATTNFGTAQTAVKWAVRCKRCFGLSKGVCA